MVELYKIATNEMEDVNWNDSITFRFRSISFLNETEEIKYKERIDKVYLMQIDVAQWVKDSTHMFADYDIFIQNIGLLKNEEKTSFLKKARYFVSFIEKSNSKENTKLQIEKLCNSMIEAKLRGLKLRFSRDSSWYTKRSKKGMKKKIGWYGRSGLDYRTFTYIIDVMCLMGYVDQETIPYYKKGEKNKQSRLEMTDKGYNLIMAGINLLHITKKNKFNDLIVMKDNFEIKVKDKNGNSRTKTISKTIPYEMTDHVRRKQDAVKRINNKYKDVKITIKTSNYLTNDCEFLNNLLCYHIKGIINIRNINCISKDYISLYVNKEIIKFYNRIYNFNISDNSFQVINDINTIPITNSIITSNNIPIHSNSILPIPSYIPERYLIEKDELTQNYKEISCQNIDKYFLYKELEFDILNLDLHRVFSRNCQSLHGRFYGVYSNFPKMLRSCYYLNNGEVPMSSRDFSSLHFFLAYHSEGEQPPPKIYRIKGYDEKLMKKAALISLNVKRSSGKNPYQGAISAIQEHEFKEKKLTWGDAQEYLMTFISKRPKIEKYIASDQGIKAMWLDGMMMEDMLLNLTVKSNCAVLPFHDEIVFPPDKESVELAIKQMSQSYRKVLATYLQEKGTLKKGQDLPEWIQPNIHE